MITGQIYISTTWLASTSYVPFDIGMPDAQLYGGNNRGSYGTTAYVYGVWEAKKYEEDYKNFVDNRTIVTNTDGTELNPPLSLVGDAVFTSGMAEPLIYAGNAFSPGTMIECRVRKIKVKKQSPNRSGVQISRRLLKGNKLVFKYVAKGSLVRP